MEITERKKRLLILVLPEYIPSHISQQACENGVANILWYQPKCQKNLKMKKGSSTIGIQIVYNVLGNPLENHMVVFQLIHFSLLGIILLGPKV